MHSSVHILYVFAPVCCQGSCISSLETMFRLVARQIRIDSTCCCPNSWTLETDSLLVEALWLQVDGFRLLNGQAVKVVCANEEPPHALKLGWWAAWCATDKGFSVGTACAACLEGRGQHDIEVGLCRPLFVMSVCFLRHCHCATRAAAVSTAQEVQTRHAPVDLALLFLQHTKQKTRNRSMMLCLQK